MSSIEVAEAVSQGKADVGIGIEAEAVTNKLDFVPISEEQYDFVVNKSSLGKQGVKLFLGALVDKDFLQTLNNVPGIKTTKFTGKPILVGI